jgi:hypothetical protein
MIIDNPQEIYQVRVFMKSGVTIEGFAPRGGDIEGFWICISRTDDMQNATYINRDDVSYIELREKQ